MDITLPVLVSINAREIYSVQIPGVTDIGGLSGPSLSRLLDDLALRLMENVPKMSPHAAAKLAFSPYVELRRVRLEVPLGKGKNDKTWKGRLPVVLDRWPKERFIVATLPVTSFAGLQLAISKTGALSAALTRYLSAWLEKRSVGSEAALPTALLDAAACQSHEYLELLTVDVELPTILPSRPKKSRKKKTKTNPNRSRTASKQKKRELIAPRTLSQISENLTHRALDGRLDRAFYRDAVVDDIVRQLEREGAALLLVGPSGVGKTAIVHEVVHRLVADSSTLKDRRDVWQVDGNRIIAGMSIVGAWEQRVTSMVHELHARQDILFVNDLPALVYTGRSAHSDTNVAEFLEPHLGRQEIRMLGECTPERLAVLQDEAPGFFARFRVIQIPEMSEQDALHVLLHVARRLDRDEPLSIAPSALETTVALTRRFRALDVHPGKAVDLLSRALSDRTEVVRDDFGRRRIHDLSIIRHFARQAGLPEFLLLGQGGPSARDVRTFFERRIVGQPEAVDIAVDVVTTVSQALNDPARPIATMLFVGPTGVGKTETAKALTEYLFASPHRMIRFDMSEFQHPASVSRLIGDRLQPDGELTRRIQQQPFSLILFDEIEKAHPALFDALLQVLGEGRLTNAAGRTVNFTSSVIIMTSNLGVRDAEKTVGFGEPTVQSLGSHYRSAAEKFFRPEFFNRIDRVVAFRQLDRGVIIPLVSRLVAQMLSRQGLKRSSVLVGVDAELPEVLVDQGFDKRYGARSVKRILEQRLAVPLSQHLVQDHSSDLRLVEVFPTQNDLGLIIQVPQRPSPEPVKGSAPPRNWKQVEARHAGLRLAIDALVESETLAQHGAEHSTLLDAMNVDALTEAGQSRLLAIATIQEQLTELTESLDIFEDAFLRIEQFVIEHTTEVVHHRDHGTRTTAVDRVRAQRTTRNPLRDDVIRELEALELTMARVDHQLSALSARHDDRLLIRFLSDEVQPLYQTLRTWICAWGQASDHRVLVHDTASNEREPFYRPWGAVTRIFVLRNRRWQELIWDPDGPGSVVWHLEGSVDRVEGAALWLRGPGLRDLIEPELGLWVWRHQVGPDYHLNIVRVEDVGGEGDPIERLDALDASLQSVREARRRGQVDGPLWPNAPILRWFDNDEHKCRQTNVEYRRQRNQVFLQQVVLRRLHAKMMDRILSEVPES